MATLQVNVGLPTGLGSKILNAVAKRTAELMRSETVPEIAAASPRRSGRLAKGWSVRARRNVIEIRNTQFYVAFQKSSFERRFEKLIVDHARRLVTQAYQEVGLPMLAEAVADEVKGAVRKSRGRPGASGVSLSYRRGVA